MIAARAPGSDVPDGRGARPLVACIDSAIPIANPGETAGTVRARMGGPGTGALLGLALALRSFGAVWTVFGEPRLALAVALELAAAGTIATGVGFLLAWVFQRVGFDPALGSGPVATVVQDVLSLAIHLGLVGLLPA